MNLNRLTLAGNLTRDPQLKYLPNGNTAVVEFGLAINRKWKTSTGEARESVVFCDVTAFGKTAELIQKHFVKGMNIFLEGRLKFDTWEDRETGGKRQKLSVIADNFQFVGPPRTAAPGTEGEPATGESGDFREDDIPF